jgi:hypothetical protein
MIANINQSIANEVARATSAETALDEKIENVDDKLDQEIAARENEDSELWDAINEEISARTADVNAEEARAISAETELSDRISAIESASTKALEDEIARAISAETALDEKINAESQRALSAETDLLDIIETEVTQRKAETVASVDYDESGKTIDFYNANNVKIDSIDATAFIKDGMIESVTLETTGDTTYLVIVWNTDAGKETTRIDIGDLFNADNYYTKSEIDDFLGTGFSVSSVTEVIEENERVTSNALNDLNTRVSANTDAISAEATARQNADVVSMAVGATAGITLTLGDGSTIVATEAEEITLSAGEF